MDFQLDLPFLAPIFALIFTAPPGTADAGPKKLLVLVVALMTILGVGLLLIRMLQYQPLTAVLIIVVGIYASSYLAVNLAKGPVAIFLTISLTLIPAMGTISWALAATLIDAVALGVVVAIRLPVGGLSDVFPEVARPWPLHPRPEVSGPDSNWIALRATVIITPVFLLLMTNPSFYAPIMMKSSSLGQQASMVAARDAGRELLGSTFLGGCFAVLIWAGLGIATNLWMFFLWMLLFGVYYAGKLNQVIPSRYPPSFWTNAVITALILLGSAVQDSDAGKDVYQAFAVRISLFVAVTLYAWFAIQLLEQWRIRSRLRPDVGSV